MTSPDEAAHPGLQTRDEFSPPGAAGHLRRAHPSRPVRILVVDDHEGFRSSMVQALDLIPDVEVAGEARSGEEACDIVVTLKPDVVLLDLSMPGMDAMDATRQIRRSNPASQVVVLSAFDGPQVEQAAVAAGAWGLVPKGTPLEDVVGVLLNAAEQSSQ